MNTEQKKIVTEWLGKHEQTDSDNPYTCSCGFRTTILSIIEKHVKDSPIRTFTEWSDFGAVWERLVETGSMVELLHSAKELQGAYKFEVLHYLLSRTEDGTFRLCELIAQAIEEGILK